MRKLRPDEVTSLFRERDELAARERKRGSGLPPDLEALAARIFGEEKAPDFGDSLERLTVALVALRTAFVPDPPAAGRIGREAFLGLLERFGRAAATPAIVPRGELSEEAPELLLNPAFWLALEGTREAALLGDEAASRLLEKVLNVLKVPKRRTDAGRAKAASEREAVARELLRDPEFMASPLALLAVEITRDGERGPVPLRAAELAVNGKSSLLRVLRLEAGGKRKEAVRLRADLAAGALAAEGRRLRAAKRKRAKTRGPK